GAALEPRPPIARQRRDSRVPPDDSRSRQPDPRCLTMSEDLPRPSFSPASVRSIHVIAVGGVGMTALAGLLKAAGYEVRGSDEELYPPMSLVVARIGITVFKGYRPENLSPPPDLV